MKLLVDMNLSPDWVARFQQEGWEAIHWMQVGDQNAKDNVIMDWARENDYIVLTHDLDSGIILAATLAKGPSVVQFRIQDIMPEKSGQRIIRIIRKYESQLDSGALITVDEKKSRVRILPF